MNLGNEYAVFNKHKLNEFLSSVLNKRQDSEKVLSLLLLCISLGYEIYKTAPLSYLEIVGYTLLIVAFVGVFISLSYSVIKWVKYRKLTPEYIKKELSKVEAEHDITAVLIIKRYFSGTPKVLVRQYPAWGYLLPYIKLSTLDNENSATAAVSKFFRSLFRTSKGEIYLSGHRLENIIKIHPRKNEIMKFTFGIFAVTGASYDDISQVLQDNEYRDYKWMSINEILNDATTMKYNSEVINALNEENLFLDLQESFSPEHGTCSNLPKQLKVIWNITDVCEFDCSFCGTNRVKKGWNDPQMDFQHRIEIAEELLKTPGVKIDIAGGDPLIDKEAKKAIFHILKYMTRENITITSTGKAYRSLKQEEIQELLTSCSNFDLSYDFPSNWEANHRGPQYNQGNFAQLKFFSKRDRGTIGVTVLVTLSKENTSMPDTINSMITELSESDIHLRNIKLLRLMPVGKQKYNTYPKEYNPLQAISSFKQKFGDKVKLHCAFRAALENDGACNMLTEKIGVDHEGNVFACAWAGYLEIEQISENPFYLGNIIEDGGLEAIFKSEKFLKLKNIVTQGNNRGCRIFSFLENPDKGLLENHDPLCEKNK